MKRGPAPIVFLPALLLASCVYARSSERPTWQRADGGWRVQRVQLSGAPNLAVRDVAPPIPAGERATMLATLRGKLAALDQAIDRSPRDLALHSRRGDCQLFLGRAPAAVADFERMIAIDPAQDAPHWRLGIAYFFSGEFARSAQQFEKYHRYDGGDRENGLWKFLGDVKVVGVERARREMLVYTRFDREPFPALYELFAGTMTTAAFFAGIKARQLETEARVMFFAHYYAGLHEEILGHRDQALAFLREAVANPWGRTAESGPAYMWQVARLHFEALDRAAATSRRD